MTLTAKRALASLSLTALLVPIGSASALAADAPAWTGDYQTGNLSQWTDVHVARPDGAVVVTSPVRDGYTKSAKFTVRPGDRTFGQVNEERAEVMSNVQQSGSVEGAETWHGWSSLFPAGTSVEPGSWLAFSQWHQTANTCPPNVAFMITDSSVPRIRLSVRGGALNLSTCAAATSSTYDLGVLPVDNWTDFTVHGKWSSDPAKGSMEVKLNGRTVLPPTPVANLYTGQAAYFKQGIYRGNMSRTTVIYHTGTRRGATETSVALAGTGPVAAPTATTVTVGSGSRELTGTNVPRTTDALVAYDRSNGWTASPANAYGFEAAVVGGKVVAVSDLATGMPIPENGMVLSGHGSARDWLKLHATVGAGVAR